ncbi:DUF5125 domain-containing protein [Sphingobacterium sp. N143]|uniref:DUF5125 domain-containing protein n=1 Tax=Sphingobacterium sp. N143 TaxID=2746727 RepID=UPI0025784AA4|nr:DUF5125 domain-containing protein [Sphingobacterium sp. N143]MDM1295418.1 DUF5125 domain-containing protein [Sphingobacterium sp. N143]
MKRYLIHTLLGAIAIVMVSSCKEDEKYVYQVGDPKIELQSDLSSAHFGDSLAFQVSVSDKEVALSTLKAQLYFTDEQVTETIIRTKGNGEYKGKIYVPFLKNVPNGKATLKFILENISQKKSEQSLDIDLSRPDFPYLTLVTGTKSYRMIKTAANQYAVKESFPFAVKGYIQAPKVGAEDNAMSFGWVDNKVDFGSTAEIPFSNSVSGVYSIAFNTLSYEASPFIIAYAMNGTVLSRLDDTHFKAELTISKGSAVTIDGIEDLQDWWIDPDFFITSADGSISFNGSTGKYRVTADLGLKYFAVEAMTGNDLATLQEDGTGAVWIIGEGIGKPKVSNNQVGWNTDKALCMVPLGNKKYQVTVKAGESINSDNINFKFFHQKGWGGEFGGTDISTSSDIVFIGDGDNGRDSGNLGIKTDKLLEAGKTYTFTLDLTAGNKKAVLKIDTK